MSLVGLSRPPQMDNLMRNNNQIQFFYSPLQELRGNNPGPHILIFITYSPVHQDRPARGIIIQGAVALSHIKKDPVFGWENRIFKRPPDK